jgi:thiol:disulfide interchange protein DsbC
MLYFNTNKIKGYLFMKERLFYLAMIFLFLNILQATEIITDQTKLQALKTKNAVLKDSVLHLLGAIEKPHSYILKIEAKSPRGSQLLYAILDKQTNELYIGSAYNKDGKPILFPKDVQVIKDGVSFSYGKGSKEIYIVTDPECPYCTRFEKSVAGKLSDYTVHVILFPLSFHKKAPAMVEWIMQGKDDVQKKKRFEEILLKGSTTYSSLIKDAKKPFVYSKQVDEAMKKSDRAVMELNVRGTPSIYDKDFNPVSQDQLFKGMKK